MSPAFRALLIGVPTYRDDAFPPMPFIDTDLDELSEALTTCGYDVEQHDRSATDGESIQDAIETFITGAGRGETLLIYLSGHGVHHEGMDYLIPESANPSSIRFPAENCVPITCDAYIEQSAAATVIVVVDACREGVTLRVKGQAFAEGWGEWQRDKTVAQQVAYLYACSPGETAGFSKAGFSVMSRALSQALLDESEPGTLAQLLALTTDKLGALIAEHNVRPHHPRVRTDVDQNEIVVVPRLGQTVDHKWITAARDSTIWPTVENKPGLDELRAFTIDLVSRLATSASRLPADAWLDHQAFALRMSDKIQWLVRTVNRARLDLSAADAALLVAFPFLHQAYWARLAEELRPTALEDPDFVRFRAGYPRLERRIAAATKHDADSIERWLFLRWLIARPASYDHRRLAEHEALVGEVFDRRQLVHLFRVLHMDPTVLVDGPLATERPIASSLDDEQEVHEQLLGFLLVGAYRFAIDPIDLGQVIVDHLGTADPVDLTQLTTTLAGARWKRERRSRSLFARCHHQAVHHALQLHAETVNALLVHVERIGPDALADMPSHANAELLEAALDERGVPLQISEGFRFRLAEDQIQELLMGEQLYGDPALAVRELYQNSLDACRYRVARTQYLKATNQRAPAWRPTITFNQGTEYGRDYLDCIDNGVGMGLRELTDLFAQAGVRFTALPEYLEEEALWRDHNITLYPNSQFGIGVLSYFMLADEITVTTTRFRRDAQLGPKLEVHIAGPGTLSRVRDLGPGTQPGTRVRLHLRKDVSCVDILRRILWVSDFHVTATDRTRSLAWLPGHLSEHAPIGESDGAMPAGASRYAREVDATPIPTLWWCDTNGGILADGLWASERIFGSVINLTGSHTPMLTVDRRRIVGYDKDVVRQLRHDGIPNPIRSDSAMFTYRWLARLAEDDPKLADAVYQQRLRLSSAPWVVAGHETNVSDVGCFPRDGDIFSDSIAHPDRTLHNESLVPEDLVAWRLRAWVRAGNIDGLTASSDEPRARPSDLAVFHTPRYRRDRDWFEPGEPGSIPIGRVLSAAARSGYDHVDIVNRLAALGYDTTDLKLLPRQVEPATRYLVSVYGDGEYPWLENRERVSPGHVLQAALLAGLSTEDVVARLTAIGFDTASVTGLSGSPQRADLAMLSEGRNGTAPWLDPDQLVRPGHVLSAAAKLGTNPGTVAVRLEDLGFRVHRPGPWPELRPSTLALVSSDLNGHPLWLHPLRTVSPGLMALAVEKLGLGTGEVYRVLQELNFRLPAPETVPARLDDSSMAILRSGFGWLDIDAEVPLGHMAEVSAKTQFSVAEIIDRLTGFGFGKICEPADRGRYSKLDVALLSRDGDDLPRWLDLRSSRTSEDVIVAAARVEMSPRSVANRYREMGFDTPEPASMPDDLDWADRLIISVQVDGNRPRLDAATPVPSAHIMVAAAETRLGTAEVTARLRNLGYDVSAVTSLPAHVDRDDEFLLSSNDIVGNKWLDGSHPIPASHLIQIWLSGRDVAKSARRLVELGLRMPEGIGIADS